MSKYLLKINQIVNNPRRRMHRQLIRTIMEDRSIRKDNGSGLSYLLTLCSYASSQKQDLVIDGEKHKIGCGEWICSTSEIMSWLNLENRSQLDNILTRLRADELIAFSFFNRDKHIKFSIRFWSQCNTANECAGACGKDRDFFFVPTSIMEICFLNTSYSEADILLDIWMNAIHNDNRIPELGSDPIVSMEKSSRAIFFSDTELVWHWKISELKIMKALEKFEKLGHIALHYLPESSGFAICLKGYMATTFQISDLMLDKAESPMSLSVKIELPDNIVPKISLCLVRPEHRSFVSYKRYVEAITLKAVTVLSAMGVKCCDCQRALYHFALGASLMNEGTIVSHQDYTCNLFNGPLLLTVHCGARAKLFTFMLTLTKEAQNGNLD